MSLCLCYSPHSGDKKFFFCFSAALYCRQSVQVNSVQLTVWLVLGLMKCVWRLHSTVAETLASSLIVLPGSPRVYVTHLKSRAGGMLTNQG